MNSTTTFSFINEWSTPELIGVHEIGDAIELVYKETSSLLYAVHPSTPPEARVFKFIFSCKDGKWNKSERIYGELITATEEYYEF